MLSYLDRQTRLTGNQRRVIVAAALGDLLEFFDYFLIGYVMPFIVGPWKLTFGKSAFIMLTSGFGLMAGAFFYGWLADRLGRRNVFMLTVANFSAATGAMTFTPQNGWVFLSVFRFITGFGAGGFYSVSLPLVQEVVPASKRGLASGIVTSTVPLGTVLAAVTTATLTPYVGWRGLFAIAAAAGVIVLMLLAWVPESPRWLLRKGRTEAARRSVAWALEMDPTELPLTAPSEPERAAKWVDIFRYPRSLVVSWLANLGGQTGGTGYKLWMPTLLAQVLDLKPGRAAFFMIWVDLAGFFGRIAFSILSETIGRRLSAGIFGFVVAILLVLAALSHDVFIGALSLFWVLLIVIDFFREGCWAIIAPYSAEIWPARLRATGMGSAYGFGGLGKVIGPLGLAVIVGTSNIITPRASIDALLPACVYLASCFVVVSLVFLCVAKETKGRTLEAIERDLEGQTAANSASTTEVSEFHS